MSAWGQISLVFNRSMLQKSCLSFHVTEKNTIPARAALGPWFSVSSFWSLYVSMPQKEPDPRAAYEAKAGARVRRAVLHRVIRAASDVKVPENNTLYPHEF